MTHLVTPFSLQYAPSLIERVFPAQKISVEAFNEQMAGHGKTLTPLGGYWKGRKPLILNKACILGSLLPATDNPKQDLEIFDLLMGMDHESLIQRLPRSFWKDRIPSTIEDSEIRAAQIHHLTTLSYREIANDAKRPEEIGSGLSHHIWDEVNAHLGTKATSIEELIEQLGIMRYGHRPRVGDSFCGSGQIPFEAARLGCDVVASDLNPIATMLTYGSLNIVGGTPSEHQRAQQDLEQVAALVQSEMATLGVESDGKGWTAKAYLYCLEVTCPKTGWMVPVLPSLEVSVSDGVVIELIPDEKHKRYDIRIKSGLSAKEYKNTPKGTLRKDGRGSEPYLCHTVDGVTYRTAIATIRGDVRQDDGSNGNALRLWTNEDILPHPDDLFQERLYAIHWRKPIPNSTRFEYEFRAPNKADLHRENIVRTYVESHFAEWQKEGWLPNSRIHKGDETERLYRERGWTHWHHLFNPRQLLMLGLLNKYRITKVNTPSVALGVARALNRAGRLCIWNKGGNKTEQVFYNQALNTLYTYASRSWSMIRDIFANSLPNCPTITSKTVKTNSAKQFTDTVDICITDPPYGDAVNYDEILDYFISWLEHHPCPEFKDWIWDSRRALAIKGDDEDFRQGMIAAYRQITSCQPDNGIQVLMFTHQSPRIWADLSNIVWASGLQVTAAWYVATETESGIRQGGNIKGTILLVLKKHTGNKSTTKDDLAWEIQDAVQEHHQILLGLNQDHEQGIRSEHLFEDVDLQMAGYAAALKVLTSYSLIDGRNMKEEAIRPRIKGQPAFIDSLIDFARTVANDSLVLPGFSPAQWSRLNGTERFYLKMLGMEHRCNSTLDNYINFAKAFHVQQYKSYMHETKANQARLKSPTELAEFDMWSGSKQAQSTHTTHNGFPHGSALRGLLYAISELACETPSNTVLKHLSANIPGAIGSEEQRRLLKVLSHYLAEHMPPQHVADASAARILRDLLATQYLE